jgi:hypothetical protein
MSVKQLGEKFGPLEIGLKISKKTKKNMEKVENGE